MNKKNIYSNIWAVILLVFCSVFVFTTCENNDALSTDTMNNGATTLKAFGPNPALRGQKLSFAGTHLDKITKVILPNGIEITDIEVVNDKLIKVLVPQETVEGIVKLIGPNNLELTSKEPLTISEPIEITKMTPQPVKAGQVLTIEGNYFNLITKLIFTDKVEVQGANFKTWTRTKIELVVPAEAQSGVVILANNDSIPLEFQSPEALQVVLPSVNSVLDLTNRKPGDAISAPGKDLDLVVKVEMPSGDAVPFTIENSTLKFTLPENVSDGAIVMIPVSGVRVAIANIGVAIPSELVVTPDKGLRAGAEITIKGINMELVKSVKFPGVDAAVAPSSKSAVEIKVTMPEKAISGDIVLNTASGKTVTAAIETQKPDVVAYNPSHVSAGSDVKLQGHNLDLVTTVTFAADLVVSVTPSAANELVVNIPLNAVSGMVILTMANGETVECPNLEITVPEFAYLPNPPGPKAEIHAGAVLTLAVENGSKLSDVLINGSSVKYILDAPKLYIVIPNNAKGNTELKLVSSNGTAVYTIPVIGAGITETIAWEGLVEFSGWNNTSIPNANFQDAKVGDRIKFYLTKLGAAPALQVYYGDWGGQIVPENHPDYVGDAFKFPAGTEYFEIVLTAEMIQHILNPAWGSDAMILQGDGLAIFKISLITGNAPTEAAIFEGSHNLNWSNALRLNKESFQGVHSGTLLKFYYNATSGDPQVAIQDANWTKLVINDPNFDATYGVLRFPVNETSYEIELTSEILNTIMTVDDGYSSTAIVVGGDGMTITKVTLIGN